MCNADVRTAAKNAGVFLYQVAAAMGISEPTMTRKLRFELPDEEKQNIFETISKIASNRINNKEV
ncbi:MAG: hypothetical protein J6K17_05095 [Oscillospiraceae bacterium]|nr:hypothetical protein [Oscillospiraceae bacterium]